jgi:hypothetical protein
MQIKIFDRSICTHDPSTNIAFLSIQLQCRFNYSIDPYIRCIHLFDQSISTHFISFIYSIDQNKVLREPYLDVVVVVEEEVGVDGGNNAGGGQRRRWRRRRRRPASTTVVTTGGDLECFGMKSEMTWGGLLFICLKILAVVLN